MSKQYVQQDLRPEINIFCVNVYSYYAGKIHHVYANYVNKLFITLKLTGVNDLTVLYVLSHHFQYFYDGWAQLLQAKIQLGYCQGISIYMAIFIELSCCKINALL